MYDGTMNANAYPTVSTYSDLEGLPVGTIVNVPSESDEILNAANYDVFKVVSTYGESWLEPVRENIVAEYTENGLGYLIQKSGDGYRYIAIEAGEEDEFGEVVATESAAAKAAVADWEAVGNVHFGWVDTLSIAAGTAIPDYVLDKIENFFKGHAATKHLSAEEIANLTNDLARAI